jgi:HSP20 family protein
MRIKDLQPVDFTDLNPFQQLDRLMHSSWFNFNYPRVDILDEKDKVKVIADLPGINKDDIKVKIEKDRITIKAIAQKELEEEKENYYRLERNSAGYYREIALPTAVQKEGSKASFKNGVLTIELLKKKEGEDNDVKIE